MDRLTEVGQLFVDPDYMNKFISDEFSEELGYEDNKLPERIFIKNDN